MTSLSSKFSSIEKDKDALKRGYTDLKMKYMTAKANLKKLKEEQANNINGNNEQNDASNKQNSKQEQENQSNDNQKTGEETNDESKNEEFQILQKKCEELKTQLNEKTRLLIEQQGLFEDKLEKQKLDFEEKEEELIEAVQEKEKIEKLLNSFKEKRELAISEIQKLKKQLSEKDEKLAETQSKLPSNQQVIQSLKSVDDTSLNYNINPEKLDNFLKNLLQISNSLYKNFMMYVATSEEAMMIQVETSINKSIELISEFNEYSTAKLRYLQKQKNK